MEPEPEKKIMGMKKTTFGIICLISAAVLLFVVIGVSLSDEYKHDLPWWFFVLIGLMALFGACSLKFYEIK